MRVFPTPYPNEPKIFSVCGLTVARRDCHKNRYGKYICKNCQAAGVKPSLSERMLRGARRAVRGFWLGLAGVMAAGVLAWISYALFVHVDIFRFFQPLVLGEGSLPLTGST